MPRSQLERALAGFVVVFLFGAVRVVLALATSFSSPHVPSPSHPSRPRPHAVTERDVTNTELDRFESVMGCVEASSGVVDRAASWLDAFGDPNRDAVGDVARARSVQVPTADGVSWLQNAPMPWPQIASSVERLVSDRAAVAEAMEALHVAAARRRHEAIDEREIARLVEEIARRYDIASASEVAFYDTFAERRHHVNLRMIEAMRHDVHRIDEAYFLQQYDAAEQVWLVLRPHSLLDRPIDRPRLAAAVAHFHAMRDEARASTYGTVHPAEIDVYLDALDALLAAPEQDARRAFVSVGDRAARLGEVARTVRYEI